MTPWILVIGSALVHFTWQGTVLAAIAALGLARLEEAAAETRYKLASLTLALMLAAPIVTAVWLSSARLERAAAGLTRPSTPTLADVRTPPTGLDGTVETTSVPERSQFSHRDRAFAVVVTVWLSGVLLLSVRLLGGWWRIRCLQRSALLMPLSRWQGVAQRLACRLGVRRPIHVVDCSTIEAPSVIGWWRPVLLLPIAGFAGLTLTQADAVLTHELAHVRRHDYLVNVLQHIIETILFYHPAVWWISHRMRVERELCCDAVVVRICGDARDYAMALMQLEQARTGTPASLVVAATDHPLVARVRRLLTQRGGRPEPLVHAVISSAMVIGCVLMIAGAFRSSLRTVQAQISETAATIGMVGDEPIPARAYAEGLAARKPQAHAGTQLPGRLTDSQPDWHVTATAHFDIVTTPNLASQVERMQRAAERAYQQVSRDLRHELNVRPTLVLFATRAAARADATLPPTTAPSSPRVVFLLDQLRDDAQVTVTHEVAHIFAHDLVPRATLAAAPRWIVEGLSEHEGGAWASSDHAILRELVRLNTVPPLATLDMTDDPRLPYSIGHAAFDFIAGRWGPDGIRQLLLALANGADRQTLYTTAWGISAEEVDHAFATYLQTQFPAADAVRPPDLRAVSRTLA
jgi:beta-lactamase regulating signal transducer with metallopeptidase domain